MTQSVNDTLQARQHTHGSFSVNSQLSQTLKQTVAQSTNYPLLTDYEKEAIEMICHKISRILSGNPHFMDSWRDIAGYASLVVGELAHHPQALDCSVITHSPMNEDTAPMG